MDFSQVAAMVAVAYKVWWAGWLIWDKYTQELSFFFSPPISFCPLCPLFPFYPLYLSIPYFFFIPYFIFVVDFFFGLCFVLTVLIFSWIRLPTIEGVHPTWIWSEIIFCGTFSAFLIQSSGFPGPAHVEGSPTKKAPPKGNSQSVSHFPCAI